MRTYELDFHLSVKGAKVLFFILLLITTHPLFCQYGEFKIINYTDRHGLPSNVVNKVFKDSRGLLWIGTSEGLLSYDTYTFKLHRKDIENPQSLSDNSIFDISEDQGGNLYIGTFRGLNIYNRKSSTFSSFLRDTTSKAIITANFFLLAQIDKAGDVWSHIPEGGGYTVLNAKTKKFQIPAIQGMTWLTTARDGSMWVASSPGGRTEILKLESQSGKIETYPYDFPETPLLKNKYVRRLAEDPSGNLWIGLEWGISKLDTRTGRITHFLPKQGRIDGLPTSRINAFDFDEEGNVWLGSDSSGVIRFNPVSQKCVVFSANPKVKNSIPSNSVSSIKYDNGILWAATNRGLSKIVVKQKKFNILTLYKDLDDNTLFDGEEVRDVLRTRDGHLYFSTSSGLYEPTQFNKVERVYEGEVKEFVEDRLGNLWLAGYKNGLKKYNVKSKIAVDYRVTFHKKDTLPLRHIWSAYLDHEEILWLGTGGDGVVGVELSTGKITTFTYDPNNPNSISAREVGPLFREKDNLWIGPFQGGINKINLKTGKITKFKNIPSDPNSLSSNIATAILKDSKDRVWIGTLDGLNLLDEKSNKSRRFREKDGLASSSIGINGIIEDKSGSIWVINQKGISKFNENTLSFRSYDTGDGLPNNIAAGYYSKQGEIFVFGKNGITSFYASQINDNRIPPQVLLTDIQLFNKSLTTIPDAPIKGNIGEVKEITLNYDQSFLTFEFAALNFNLSDKNQYAYKMEGVDKDWNYSGTRRLAYYTSIPPGNYVFKVKAANNDGVWNKKGASIKIIITPPFWQTWWFNTLLVVVITGAAVSFYIIRMNAIKAQKRELEKQVTERTAEVVMQKEELEAQAEELLAANEEIKTQSEKVEDLYKEMKDSVRAAQIIQQSILPSEKFIRKHLPEFFILNKPKDVVSGDFYWFDVIDEKIIIAAVDCTGHGVSGAFMSITGHFLLNQAIKATVKLTASDILEKLHEGVLHELHHQNENADIQDGMDIALCILDKKGRTVQFAGANNPLYILRNKEIIQVKGNKYSIGLTMGKSVGKFTNHEITLQDEDLLYIFSDGYADQLGGDDGQEKFMYSRFRNLLLEIHEDEMKKQMQKLDENLVAWRKEVEQLDDVMVIGVKI